MTQTPTQNRRPAREILLLHLLKTLTLAAAIASPLAVPAGSLAQAPAAAPANTGLSAEKLGRIKPVLQQLVDRKEVSGVVTIVAHRGQIAYSDAVGFRDIEAGKPMQLDTIFRIYSMSKPVTSVATMMLQEDGKLDVNEPVSKYLPELAGLKVFVRAEGDQLETEDVRRQMTIADLLRHTSGLTYGIFGSTPIDRRYLALGVLSPDAPLADMVRKLSGVPLLYQPGSRFNYSVSSDVLGRVVEVVSGMPFDKFLRDRLFDPLGMKDTGFFVPADKLDRFATNYGPQPGGGLRVIDAAASSPFRMLPPLQSGGAGLVSTAPDYIRFCMMLENGGELDGKRLLKAGTVAAMTKNQLPDGAYPIEIAGFRRQGVGFGYGFSVVVERLDAAPYVPIGEYGWGGAASTHFWISPKDDVAVVVLSQYMPFTMRLESAVKPLVYDAIEK